MQLTFALRWAQAPLRPAAAWLLPGADPAAWLAALCAWNAPQASLTLLRLARADGVGGSAGLLVIPAGPTPTTGPPGAAAFGRLGRLLLPVDARLDPEATPEELEGLASSDATLVWHPALGLVAFGRDETLRVADLLQPPPLDADTYWDRALPGVAVNHRLHAIACDEPLSTAAILNNAGGDIGTQAPSPQALPPRPDEATPLQVAMQQAGAQVGRAVGAAAGIVAAGVGAVAGGLAAIGGLLGGALGGLGGGGGGSFARGAGRPRPPSGASWLGAVQQWARQMQRRWADQLDAQRHREVRRLLDLLERRPDEGLKFALPLTGGEAARGLGAGGGSLVERDTNFSLRGVAGSGTADPWTVDDRYRRQLEERYRELANRELTLGRHRRAAYILAQLLGDFGAAAKALEQGRHYREAAVLYREKLRALRDAARCLRLGGLFAEAVALYEELRDYETVGDLYTELEEPEQAAAAYRRAIDARRAADDRLGAARLWEEKLHDLDGAYTELRAGWPCSSQATRCLEQAFALLGRRGKHAESGRLVAELPGNLPDAGSRTALTERFAHLAVNYPDAEVRHAALDGARVLVAGDLQRAAPDKRRRLMEVLRSLVPGDKLLARDCRHYLHLRDQALSRVAQRVQHAGKLDAPLLRTIRIAEDVVAVESIIAHGSCYYALLRMGATDGNGYRLVRGRWDGKQQAISLAFVGATAATRWMLALSADGLTLRVEPTGSVVLPVVTFPLSSIFGRELRCRSSASSSVESLWAIGAGAGLDLSVVFQRGGEEAIIRYFATNGSLFGTRSVPLPQDPSLAVEAPVPLVRHRGVDVLGLGRWLVFVDETGTHYVEFQDQIAALALSTPRARPPRLAVLQAGAGGVLFWDLHPNAERETFAQNLGAGVVHLAFTSGGWLVAASYNQLEVYHVDERLRHIATVPGPGQEVAGLFPTDQPNQVAVCTVRGEIRIHQLPPPRR